MAGSRPTNLKHSHECGSCKYFMGPDEGKGVCKMPKFLNYPVDEDDVCDEWTAGDPQFIARNLWAKHRRRLAKEA